MYLAVKFIVVTFMLASAFALYAINYDVRGLDQRVLAEERAVEKAHADIAVLRAERAHLARPERIEPLARALGMAPATREQMVRPEDLARPFAAPAASTPGR